MEITATTNTETVVCLTGWYQNWHYEGYTDREKVNMNSLSSDVCEGMEWTTFSDINIVCRGVKFPSSVPCSSVT